MVAAPKELTQKEPRWIDLQDNTDAAFSEHVRGHEMALGHGGLVGS